MSDKDGGAAFPILVDGHLAAHEHSELHYGMSLRDWFAGQALAGQLASLSNAEVLRQAMEFAKELGGTNFEWAAISAYQFADAMLKAREDGE